MDVNTFSQGAAKDATDSRGGCITCYALNSSSRRCLGVSQFIVLRGGRRVRLRWRRGLPDTLGEASTIMNANATYEHKPASLFDGCRLSCPFHQGIHAR